MRSTLSKQVFSVQQCKQKTLRETSSQIMVQQRNAFSFKIFFHKITFSTTWWGGVHKTVQMTLLLNVNELCNNIDSDTDESVVISWAGTGWSQGALIRCQYLLHQCERVSWQSGLQDGHNTLLCSSTLFILHKLFVSNTKHCHSVSWWSSVQWWKFGKIASRTLRTRILAELAASRQSIANSFYSLMTK